MSFLRSRRHLGEKYMSRVTYKKQIEDKKNRKQFGDRDNIFVDLKVDKDNREVTRKLRLVGFPIEFMQINKKKNPSNPKERLPFHDDHLYEKTKFTRIGLLDQDECPWVAMGYPATKRWAQRCFEEQEDGTWIPKVLEKGAGIFDELASWSEGRREEDESLSYFLGGEEAPVIRIKAVFNPKKYGNVDYDVRFGSKDLTLTEEMIEQLRAVREPSAEDMAKFRKEYKKDLSEDPDLPEWHDWYEYGHDIATIFKFTPPKDAASDEEDLNFEEKEDEKKSSKPTAKTASSKPAASKPTAKAKTDDDEMNLDEAFEESEDETEDDEMSKVNW